MDKKIFLLTVFLTLFLASAANADIASITAWTNKQNYSPGEKGTLHINFLNTRGAEVRIENVTVTYKSWQAYIDGKWVGNETHAVGVNVEGGGIITLNVPFTVPSDGRAQTTEVDIRIGTNFGYETRQNATSIRVQETPLYMEQIVTLFTILTVLLIVCTIIIAATIFLSARGPQVMLKAEERVG